MPHPPRHVPACRPDPEAGDRLHLAADRDTPLRQGYLTLAACQLQTRLAPAPRHQAVIPVDALLLGSRDGRAVEQQAVNQEDFQKTHLSLVQADRVRRADIKGPQLDVLHAAAEQCCRGSFARLMTRLGRIVL